MMGPPRWHGDASMERRVRITRRTGPGIQVVTWSLRPSDNDATWVRWASEIVTTVGGLNAQWQRSLQLQGREPEQLLALRGLVSWRVYFFRGADNNWSNCQSGGVLIRGVRSVLEFGPNSGLAGSLVRDVMVAP